MWKKLYETGSRFLPGFLQRPNLTSNVMSMSRIKTFVFLDLETTGLPQFEHNLTKITEMCVVAVQADHIELGCFPRVHNKLTFCFNPRKTIHPQSTEITGLSNELLEHQAYFSSDVVEVLAKWLEMNQKPVCFVAHNGNAFDYPILKAEIEKTGASLPEDLVCVDSLVAFRALEQPQVKQAKCTSEVPFEFSDGFDEVLCRISEEFDKSLEQGRELTPEEVQKINETTPKKQVIGSQIPQSQTNQLRGPSKRNYSQKRSFTSYKLQDVFTRLTSKPPLACHEAEGDVTMLITCAAVFGEKFVDYANNNAKRFSDVRAMKPGKRIGT